MPQNYFAATQIAKGFVFSVSGVAASATAVGLGAQLNQTYAFLYLQLPLWYFYIAMIVLSFIGSFWALFTDTLQSRGNPILKVLVAVSVGLVSSFIILPMFSNQPPVEVMLGVSLAGSFSGTVLLFLIADVLNDEVLRKDVVLVVKTGIREGVVMVVNRMQSILAAIFKGGSK